MSTLDVLQAHGDMGKESMREMKQDMEGYLKTLINGYMSPLEGEHAEQTASPPCRN